MSVIRHITLPGGFVAAGVKCGIKASGKEDMAIIAADRDASMAVVTTQNQVVGEPVRLIRKTFPKGYATAKVFVINSGCSNVCTGKVGFANARKMAAVAADLLGTTPGKVLVASTGIIGHQLPMPKVLSGIRAAASSLGRDNDQSALRAIMTTDTREKTAVVQGRLGGKTVTVAGVVKGAGMIAPSMATMIGIITTDAAVAPAALYKVLRSAVGVTFNAVTVDSDTSTSDTVAIFASGAAGNKTLGAASRDLAKFADMVNEVCAALARAVAADGEGATKTVDVAVRNAVSDRDAFIAAKSVANSPLFKCAVHGADPNWGRIAAALGKSAAKIDQEKLTIAIGGITVFRRGMGTNFDVKKVRKHLLGSQVNVDCDLGLGKGKYTAITCDLSREYITINADYHT